MRQAGWLDARAGIAGDMLLGALLDAGLPDEVLAGVPGALGLEGVSLRRRAVRRGAVAATKVDVLLHGESADGPSYAEAAHEPHDHGDGHHAHRTFPEVRAIITGARDLPPDVVDGAVRVFTALAEAEARVHGTPVEAVHFHEVGHVDALVDVVGCVLGLAHLGVEELRVGPLPWPEGTVRTAHGELTLPPPAVVHLLEGFPVFASGADHEQVTPTGAALVRALARPGGVVPGFVPRRVGCGAGTRDRGPLPNVLRLVLGSVGEDATPVHAVQLDTNLDDATGQAVARALDAALAAGALDAWATPATMKKGRPGWVLSALVAPGGEAAVEAVLFRETPTLGVRRHAVSRTVLARRHVTVDTPWGPARVKVRETPDGPEGTPEHDDCLRLATAAGVALRRVIEAAREAFSRA